MLIFDTPADIARRQAPEHPVICARPHAARRAAAWFAAAFPARPFYAVKANPSPWLLTALAEGGVTAFDAASPAELALARDHAEPDGLAFLNPVKSRAAIRQAYFELGCRTFAFDCLGEMDKLLAVAGAAGDLTLVLRIDPPTEPNAAMPLAGKFGASLDEAPGLLKAARSRAARLGVAVHVGSQCMDPSAYRRAGAALKAVIDAAGAPVDVIDLGGGFPAIYPGLTPPPAAAYAAAAHDAVAALAPTGGTEIWCEPGRALAAEAVSVLARVELRRGDAVFLNDGAFGNLFDATHANWRYPVKAIRIEGDLADAMSALRVFGPTCDPMDAWAAPIDLPADLREGDYLEIGMLGAYGSALATGFNGFGACEFAMVRDDPWPSLFRDAAADPAPRRRGRGAGELAGRG